MRTPGLGLLGPRINNDDRCCRCAQDVCVFESEAYGTVLVLDGGWPPLGAGAAGGRLRWRPAPPRQHQQQQKERQRQL